LFWAKQKNSEQSSLVAEQFARFFRFLLIFLLISLFQNSYFPYDGILENINISINISILLLNIYFPFDGVLENINISAVYNIPVENYQQINLLYYLSRMFPTV